jgi:hypothetical protein
MSAEQFASGTWGELCLHFNLARTTTQRPPMWPLGQR